MTRFLMAAMAAFVVACTPPAPDVRAPTEGETSITGSITEIEDGAYPLYTVHVTPEGGAPVQFYLNAESGVDLGGAEIASFAGQTATIYFTSTPVSNISDIRTATQVSLVHDVGREVPAEGSTVTGVLSGADAITSSDLPDEITVTDAAGQAHSFEFYVDDRLMAANGQPVTVHYTVDARNEVTLMRAVGQ